MVVEPNVRSSLALCVKRYLPYGTGPGSIRDIARPGRFFSLRACLVSTTPYYNCVALGTYVFDGGRLAVGKVPCRGVTYHTGYRVMDRFGAWL